MRQALGQARQAAGRGEVPVGAVLVHGQQVIAAAANACIALHDPTAHAEILALRRAGQAIGNYRLLETTLYSTLEPCFMCVGACVHARISRLVFGAFDPQRGAVVSVMQGFALPQHNHQVTWVGGVLEADCGELLKTFFAQRR